MTQPKTIPPPTTEIPTVQGWYSILVDDGSSCPSVMHCRHEFMTMGAPSALCIETYRETINLRAFVERQKFPVYFQGPIPIWDGVKPYE